MTKNCPVHIIQFDNDCPVCRDNNPHDLPEPIPEALANAIVRGRTTEAVVRDLAVASDDDLANVLAVLAALVRRYDAKAARREAKAAA